MALHKTAARLQERLRGLGLDVEVRELADSTRTAAEAAANKPATMVAPS